MNCLFKYSDSAPHASIGFLPWSSVQTFSFREDSQYGFSQSFAIYGAFTRKSSKNNTFSGC